MAGATWGLPEALLYTRGSRKRTQRGHVWGPREPPPENEAAALPRSRMTSPPDCKFGEKMSKTPRCTCHELKAGAQRVPDRGPGKASPALAVPPALNHSRDASCRLPRASGGCRALHGELRSPGDVTLEEAPALGHCPRQPAAGPEALGSSTEHTDQAGPAQGPPDPRAQETLPRQPRAGCSRLWPCPADPQSAHPHSPLTPACTPSLGHHVRAPLSA